MTSDETPKHPPLRIFCIEDNPLIVFHVEHLIEDAGCVFLGFADSLAQLQQDPAIGNIDGALVDIDLADGRTGPDVAAWLKKQGIPCIFVTAQEDVAKLHGDLVVATITKPIVPEDFAAKVQLLRRD